MFKWIISLLSVLLLSALVVTAANASWFPRLHGRFCQGPSCIAQPAVAVTTPDQVKAPASTAPEASRPMDFKTAILAAAGKANLPAADQTTIGKAKSKHRLLWKALENWTAHRYEAQTVKEVPTKAGAYDWSKLLDWLVANLPAIIKMIMLLFGV